MIRFARAAALLAVVLLSWTNANAQQATIPEGYTPYTISGEGIGGFPPVPFKIEDDRVTTPEGAMLQIAESSLTEDRIELMFETPFGPAKFSGTRDGDRFQGLLFNLDPSSRWAIPVNLRPASEPAAAFPTFDQFASAPGVSRIEIVPGSADLPSGETRRFVARAYDDTGNEIVDPAVEWYSLGGMITEQGEFKGMNAGERIVIAYFDGAVGVAPVTISAPAITSLKLRSYLPDRMSVDSRATIDVDALNAINRWVLDPTITVSSSDTGIIAVEGTAIHAVSTGRATVSISSDDVSIEREIEVVAGGSGAFSIEGTPDGPVRTGDVVRLTLSETAAVPTWSVASSGAEVFADGSFVAEEPGRYTVLAVLGDRVATTTIEALERGVSGRIHMVGHGKNPDFFTSDLWPQDSYVYVGTHQANRLLTYDVSDPANPVLTDEQEFDARVINDVKVSEDGRWLVATREGAANRRNGILIFSLDDRARPELISEYTETLTAGVHNVFWVGNLVYAVNDGTSDMHIIDLSDPVNPREVGRWGIDVEGRSLHDIWVQDGIAYVSYMNDGLVIADVGGVGLGGTPTAPVEVSRIFYQGGPTHTAMRYGSYVFAGDEDFSLQGTVPTSVGSDPRGPIHVIDVTDIENPRYVAKYEVPEAGAHNVWIDDDVLYVAYYQGGIRAVDISGELRGDLYAQGREIAHFLPSAGPDEAARPFAPQTWGVFPMFGSGWTPIGETLFATDYNSGLWTFTVELPERPIS